MKDKYIITINEIDYIIERSSNGKFVMPDKLKVYTGIGTSLKPANEPICMARKPLSEPTVAENVLKWGTGGINIDGSRIPTDDSLKGGTKPASTHDGWDRPFMHDEDSLREWKEKKIKNQEKSEKLGRFPANVIMDKEAGRLLDKQSGISKSTGGSGKASMGTLGKHIYDQYENNKLGAHAGGLGDEGGASRFFYCPKASKEDRDEGLEELEDKLFGQSGGARQALKDGKEEYQKTGESSTGLNTIKKRKNHHPTIKPTDLMKYLIRMVTPEGGVVLDPFMGSGSTGKAAKQLGFGFVGIEKEDDYFEIAKLRIETAMKGTDEVIPIKQQEKINKFFDI